MGDIDIIAETERGILFSWSSGVTAGAEAALGCCRQFYEKLLSPGLAWVSPAAAEE